MGEHLKGGAEQRPRDDDPARVGADPIDPEAVLVRPLAGAGRCPYCHDDLGERDARWTCGDCGAGYHLDCLRETSERCVACRGGRLYAATRAITGRPGAATDGAVIGAVGEGFLVQAVGLIAAAPLSVGADEVTAWKAVALAGFAGVAIAVARSRKLDEPVLFWLLANMPLFLLHAFLFEVCGLLGARGTSPIAVLPYVVTACVSFVVGKRLRWG